MGRQTRTLPSAQVEKFVDPVPSTGARGVRIANYGVTYLTNSSAESYVLDAPVEGVRKTILRSAGGSSATVIRASTLGATSPVSFNTTGGNTIMTLAATVDLCVELMGINSTQWFIVNVRPTNLAANTTGVVASTT